MRDFLKAIAIFTGVIASSSVAVSFHAAARQEFFQRFSSANIQGYVAADCGGSYGPPLHTHLKYRRVGELIALRQGVENCGHRDSSRLLTSGKRELRDTPQAKHRFRLIGLE